MKILTIIKDLVITLSVTVVVAGSITIITVVVVNLFK